VTPSSEAGYLGESAGRPKLEVPASFGNRRRASPILVCRKCHAPGSYALVSRQTVCDRGLQRGLLKDSGLIDRIGGPMMFPQDRSLRARVTGLGSESVDPNRELTVWEILKELGQRANFAQSPRAAFCRSIEGSSRQKVRTGSRALCRDLCPKGIRRIRLIRRMILGFSLFQRGKISLSLVNGFFR